MENKRETKRELILDAAFEMITDKGYSNTKIIDIANKAGIGKGTVYEYFESKESIILELIRTKVKQDYLKLCDEVDKLATCKQKLTEYLKLEIETTAMYKSNVTDFMNEFVRGSSEISMEIMNEFHNIAALQFEYIYGVINAGIEAGEFKNIDAYAATLCFIGSMSFYISVLYFEAQCPSPLKHQRLQHIKFIEDETLLLDCLFNGLI